MIHIAALMVPPFYGVLPQKSPISEILIVQSLTLNRWFEEKKSECLEEGGQRLIAGIFF